MKKILTLFTALLLLGSMTVKADDVYIVAGNNSTIFGAEWKGDKTENKMEWEAARSLFVKTFTVAEAINGVELKVVKNSSVWIGDPLGNNVKFDLNGAGSFRVLFNTETGVASVEGAIVVPKSMYSVYAVGNGSGTWLNGADWKTSYADNKLTEVEPNVWEIAFSNVTAANGRQLKFAVNGTWDVNFGGTFSAFDAVTETASNGSNITFNSPGETSISARLDLRNCKSSDKSGGKFTVSAGSLPELHSCYVAGSSAEIFGTAWTSGLDANKMTLAGTTYTKTFTVTKAYKSVSLKAVYDGAWFGDNGENVKFSLSGAGTFTVTFDKFTHVVEVDGEIVGPEQFDFEYVTVAGNGTAGGSWVHGKDWDTGEESNRMTEVATDVYEIAFDNVSGAACQFKFSFNGGWDYQMSGVFNDFGEATAAVYNKEEVISFTPAVRAKITIRLDLSAFNFATKQGATFTVIQEPRAYVAGSSAEIFGTAWTTGLDANEMTWNEGLEKYAKVYTVDKAYKSVGLKVVYDKWYGAGVPGGEENVKFSLSKAGEFAVYFDKANREVTVAGEFVGPEQFDFDYVAVAANGEGTWAHGEEWDAATTTNRMTEVATNVYEIEFDKMPAKYCQLKFCFDGTWDHEFGGTFEAFGTASSAVYGNASSSIDFNAAAGATINVRLDMSGFNFATKEGATFTITQVEPIAALSGKFTINAQGDTAVFARGNLQYKQSSDTWRCAPNQYDWKGVENLQMGNPDYAGWLDLFCWSIGAENNYGATSAYNTALYYNKAFVDWGGLFPGDWSTLSIDEWYHVLYNRANANNLWGMAMIEDNLGMILLPDDWTAPSGATFVPGTRPTTDMWENADCLDPTMADQDHWRVNPANMPANKFSLSEWAILEAAGAVFFPYGGRRSGGYGNHTNRNNETIEGEYAYAYYENYYGSYWTSTIRYPEQGKVYWLPMICGGCNDVTENWGRGSHGWWENGRYGHAVRLVKRILRAPYTRDVTEGKYGTICLPDGGVMTNATIYTLAYFGETSQKIFFDEVLGGVMVAGNPYLFMPNEGIDRIIVNYSDHKNVAAKTVNGFVGYINGEEEDEAHALTIDDGVGNYIIQNNTYREIQAGAVAKILSHRAYIHKESISPKEPAKAPGARRIGLGTDAAQGFENIESGDQPMKVLIDGTLYILRGEKVYNVNGQVVK